MIKTITGIRGGLKHYTYITSDHVEHSGLEEAEWHEFIICQLDKRKLKLDIPEHDIFTFDSEETLQRYLKDCYGHLNYAVTTQLDALVFPNSYVITEKEVATEKTTEYIVEVHSVEDFKRAVMNEIFR